MVAGPDGADAHSPPTKRLRGAEEAAVQAEVPEQSPNDKLSYRLLAFANGFEALLVATKDENKNKAAAAVAVEAGSFSDPAGRCEGLAHYLEHMLFMGSAKYPGECEMEEFLTKNGGYSNAFTESSHTCYYLEVNKSALHTAVDMLAAFFVAPLLKTDSAEREINAIESEFRLTQNSDGSRIEQLFAHFARDGHPFRIFGWGSIKSLAEATKAAGVDLNAELRAFHSLHYRAPRIRLCVFGVEDLDSLEAAVRSSFDGLPLAPPDEPPGGPQAAMLAAAGMPFCPAGLPKLLRVRPVKDTHKVSFSWQLPPTMHLYRSKPAHYISHLIGHEGAGSLLSWLKGRGIATSLTAGISEDDFEHNSMCCIFSVDITLTTSGLEVWPDVVHATLLYLEMLRRAGPQRWVYDELRLVEDMSWRFLQETNPTDYVQNLACGMLPGYQVERQHVLKAPMMTPEWDPAKTCELLDQMTAELCIFTLLSTAYGRSKGTAGEEGEEGEGKENSKTGGDAAAAAADGDEDGDDDGEGEEDEEEEEEGGSEGGDEAVDQDAESTTPAKDPFFDLATAPPPAIEPLFGTEYWPALESELKPLLARWCGELAPGSLVAEAKAALRLPDRNIFLATDFGLKPLPTEGDVASAAESPPEPEQLRKLYPSFPLLPDPPPMPRPLLVGSPGGIRVWHWQDTLFRTPRSELWLKLSTDSEPLEPHKAAAQAHLVLLARSLTDALNETAYLAEQANLHVRISSQSYGLDVCVGGFHHKLPDLLAVVLEECRAFGDAEAWARRSKDAVFLARLGAQREQLLRGYRNAYLKPGDHAADLRRLLVMPSRQAAHERAQALEASDAASLGAFAQRLIPKLRAEVLLTGNATAEDAAELVRSLPAWMRAASPEADEALPRHPPMPVAMVPEGAPTVWVEDSLDVGNRNVALEMYWQLDPLGEDMRPKVVLDLMEAIMAEPLFDALRTKQQIGYVASCGSRCTQQVLGFSIWLMSSKVVPSEICKRVEAFLLDFREQVRGLPAEDLERHVSSLAAQKLEPDRTLLSVQSGAWSELQERQRTFDRYEREAVALASVGREDVLQLLDQHILEGAKRRMLVVAVVGGKAKTTGLAEREALQQGYPGCRVVSSQAEFLGGARFYDNFV